MNSWETDIIKEEESREDSACWLRNFPRATRVLEIPYELDDKSKFGYIVEILELHNPSFDDNLSKALDLFKNF